MPEGAITGKRRDLYAIGLNVSRCTIFRLTAFNLHLDLVCFEPDRYQLIISLQCITANVMRWFILQR